VQVAGDAQALLHHRLGGELRLLALDHRRPLIQGRHEAPGRAEPAREWFDALRAPSKEWVELDTSGHRPIFQQPGEFARAFAEKVLTAE
jgi:pimeloyl-ACP methyl ester carboxylesterase